MYIDFEQSAAPNMKTVFAKDKRGAAAIQIPQKELAVTDKNLLQPQFQHGAKDFFQLFTKPRFIIKTEQESLTRFVENDLRTRFSFFIFIGAK